MVIDITGTIINPVILLKILKKVEELPVGDILEVRTDSALFVDKVLKVLSSYELCIESGHVGKNFYLKIKKDIKKGGRSWQI